jgi:putative transposase
MSFSRKEEAVMTPPRGPKPSLIPLSAAEQQALEALIRRPSSPQQLVLRARIVLAAAQGRNHAQIARELSISIETARLWRTRWLGHHTRGSRHPGRGLCPAPGRSPPRLPRSLYGRTVCQLIAMACEIPAGSDRPISHWTPREIADEAARRGIVASISPRHVGRLLNTTTEPWRKPFRGSYTGKPLTA